jgi:aspartate kinase
MKRSVLKFGGTSVADLDKIKNIATYLKSRIEKDEQLVVVVSAMGKTTDQLLANVAQITDNPKEQDLAMLLTTGEQQTISYLSITLNDMNVPAKPLTGYQAGIETIGHHLKSRISSIKTDLFEELFKQHKVIIVAGFQGFNKDGELTTLGRGGSDTTAVALASALDCPCEIYTDVTGVYSTDPRIFKDAKRWDTISYEEMMEMSALGAGVLETRSVEIAHNNGIRLYLGKTLSKEKGTWIVPQEQMLERKAVTGVALDKDMVQVTLTSPEYDLTLVNNVFKLLDEKEINIDMISQIHTDEGLRLSFTAKDIEKQALQQVFNELQEDYAALSTQIHDEYVKVSVIGAGMRDMPGIASKIFRTLIESEIDFYQVTTSEISVSYLVDEKNGESATRKLCEAFDL